MTFMEQYFAEDARAFDETMDKIGVFIEASFRELNVNYQESEIKVLKESGTEEDLAYLMEEAQSSFKERAKATWTKIVETFRKWIETVSTKLKSFFNDLKEKKLITKMKEAIKKNPKLGDVTVEVNDIDSDEKEFTKLSDRIKNRMVKIKGKKSASESDINDMNDAVEQAKNVKRKKIRISLSALLAKFEKKSNESTKNIDNSLKTVSDNTELLNGVDNPEAAQALTTGQQKLTIIEKMKINRFTEFLSDVAHKFKKVSDNPESALKTESVSELDDILNDIFTEGEKSDSKICCDEIKDMVKDLKDAVEGDDAKAASKLLDDLKDKIEGCCEDKDEEKEDDEEVEESVSLLDELEKELFC